MKMEKLLDIIPKYFSALMTVQLDFIMEKLSTKKIGEQIQKEFLKIL